MKTINVYYTTKDGIRNHFLCTKGDGFGGCLKSEQISKEVYNHLINNGAVDIYIRQQELKKQTQSLSEMADKNTLVNKEGSKKKSKPKQKQIGVNKENAKDFARAVNIAWREGKRNFTFNGSSYTMNDAKKIIEYLRSNNG